ncbi:MAG: DNA (cytosine-5-)-methyltransferase [Thermoplasmatota archaeon]
MDAVELFAGVGGFRLGLEEHGHHIVWWNQWEPSTKTVQYAFDCYRANTANPGILPVAANLDIARVDSCTIAATKPNLLVGGFPCQDYSVMSSLRNAKGLRGPKGALWWQIERILNEVDIPYVLLENVPRLLTSGPRESHEHARAKGHDFAVILRALMDLGYAVEWRVIQADEYAHYQRRRRVFIFAAKEGTPFHAKMADNRDNLQFLTQDGFFAPKFPVKDMGVGAREYHDPGTSIPGMVDGKPFRATWRNAGVAANGVVRTHQVLTDGPDPEVRLGDIIQKEDVPEEFFLSEDEATKWKALKEGGTNRTRKVGDFTYRFAEGALSFPDSLDRASRTILTNEGSRTPNRTTHIIQAPDGRYRFLTPEECEKLNEFEPGWTAAKPDDREKETPRRWRYFMMGNALVVGLVKKMGERLAEIEEMETEAIDQTPSTPPSINQE